MRTAATTIEACLAGSCATGRLPPAAPDEPLAAAVRRMRRSGLSHLMVVDPELGVPIGVRTTLDVAGVVGGAVAGDGS